MKSNKLVIFMLLFCQLILTGYLYGQQPTIYNPFVVKVAEGFNFTEGPLWLPGSGIIFSDIPENKIYLFSEDSVISVFLAPSGNSNGLALDTKGNLLLAQHGLRQLTRLDQTGLFVGLASHFKSNRLNSPNDIAAKSNGWVYFTDPPYGIKTHEAELSFSGIYALSPAGNLFLLDSTVHRPNGIAFSPDKSTLYVTDSEARNIYKWCVVNDSVLAGKDLFGTMDGTGYADGMKVDHQGFLYVTGPRGIWIFYSDGQLFRTVDVPGHTTNCAWGNAEKTILYITSGNALYRMINKH